MEGGYSTALYFRHMFMIPIMLEKIENDTERDYFLNSNEALDYGLIDKIIETK